jgi:hypothetical protein
MRSLSRETENILGTRLGSRSDVSPLCPLELLHKADGAYTLTPTAEAYLVEGAPTYCGDIYLTWFQGRERFADCMRTGKPAIDLTVPEAEDLWVSYVAPYLILWPELAETARTRWEAVGVNAETLPDAHTILLNLPRIQLRPPL